MSILIANGKLEMIAKEILVAVAFRNPRNSLIGQGWKKYLWRITSSQLKHDKNSSASVDLINRFIYILVIAYINKRGVRIC